MATGDDADIRQRLRSLLPPSWFPGGPAPVLDGVLAGVAAPLSWAYSLYAYTLLQARIATATGVWLDRIAYDFFGLRFPRRSGESDAGYSLRIRKEILRERATRKGIGQALTDLTGRAPVLIELWNPGDCGGYDTGAMGYDQAGTLGSYDDPNQILVRAYRPQGEGVPNVSGYDSDGGGYDQGAVEWIDPAWVAGPVTDADIYAAADQTRAAGVVAWVQINA